MTHINQQRIMNYKQYNQCKRGNRTFTWPSLRGSNCVPRTKFENPPWCVSENCAHHINVTNESSFLGLLYRWNSQYLFPLQVITQLCPCSEIQRNRWDYRTELINTIAYASALAIRVVLWNQGHVCDVRHYSARDEQTLESLFESISFPVVGELKSLNRQASLIKCRHFACKSDQVRLCVCGCVGVWVCGCVGV